MSRLIPIFFILLLVSFSTLYIGPKFGLKLCLVVIIGAILEGLGFDFAGPWRCFILYRDAHGIFAQVISMILFSAIAYPLLSMSQGSLIGTHAPISLFMALEAFVFGICMQIILVCGLGVLINAGSGNTHALFCIAFFRLGQFSWSLCS